MVPDRDSRVSCWGKLHDQEPQTPTQPHKGESRRSPKNALWNGKTHAGLWRPPRRDPCPECSLHTNQRPLQSFSGSCSLEQRAEELSSPHHHCPFGELHLNCSDPQGTQQLRSRSAPALSSWSSLIPPQ